MDTQKKHKKNEVNTKTQKLENKDNHIKKRGKKREKSETHNRLPRKRKRKGKEEHTSKKYNTNWKRKIVGAESE